MTHRSILPRISLVAGIALAIFVIASHAEVRVITEYSAVGTRFDFPSVPPPANNDAATRAEFTLVDGERDRNGAALSVLHDGRVPTSEDQPDANFFFRAGSDGGRILVDLGKIATVERVSTYSWHVNTRAPQVYTLYAADGRAEGFNREPKRETDPATCGWKRIARVDTRQAGNEGGQHAVTVTEDSASGALGRFSLLLFDISATETDDPFGNTFFSEIDVVDADGPELTTATTDRPEPIQLAFQTEDGRYRFTIDATAAPDLKEWAENELIPVVREWYPKLVAMLPSDGFEAATEVTLRFRDDMGRTPASAGGGRINMNSGWFRRELDREARGSVVHEMVHVIQNYGRARRNNPDATRTPGWLVEGLADYIRWFLYEPETKGAEITARNLERARHDASYRVTGNFLNWVVNEHDGEIIRKLNAAAREGRYSEELWRDWTGHTLQELGDAWRKHHEERLQVARAEEN